MIRVTFWVLVFAKTQKGSFIESTKTQKPSTSHHAEGLVNPKVHALKKGY
jgi:hypothetical protein